MKPTLYALAGALTAVLITTTTTALAGSGVGGIFNLGVVNTVDSQTTLTGNAGSPMLKVVNQGSAAALRGDAQSGVGVNGISASGTGQSGESQSGIGMVGAHKATTGANPGVQGSTSSTDPNGAGVVGKNTGGGAGLRSIVNVGAPPLLVNSDVKVTALNADLLDGIDSSGFWKLGGNAGTSGANFVGTTDNTPLELKVNGQRALRLEPNASTPNLVGGSSFNSVVPTVVGATIGGGGQSGEDANHVIDNFGTVGGGNGNAAGNGAGAGGTTATVAGGNFNQATGSGAAVGGGTVNAASGNQATVPGGQSNLAAGAFSFAAGRRAKANNDGAFVWGDSQDANVASPATDTFSVRAAGGIWLGTSSSPAITADHFIDTSTGAFLSSAGAWTNNSDRARKRDVKALSTKTVLQKLARMPISSWSYKAEKPSVRHIGPMAQDFYSAFGLGLDDKHITTVDEGGVALAAIQGLYRQNRVLKQQNRALSSRLSRLERQMRRLVEPAAKGGNQ